MNPPGKFKAARLKRERQRHTTMLVVSEALKQIYLPSFVTMTMRPRKRRVAHVRLRALVTKP